LEFLPGNISLASEMILKIGQHFDELVKITINGLCNSHMI